LKVLALNGAIRGDAGNTARALAHAQTLTLRGGHTWQQIDLSTFSGRISGLHDALIEADAWLIASGVYWGSWGSPLQRFLEVLTPLEGTPILGKPIGVLLTCDSTDGMTIAARLSGVLASFGCLVPPCSTVVLSRVTDTTLRLAPEEGDDLWRKDDLATVLHNLAAATGLRARFRAWPIQPVTMADGPYPAPGVLPLSVEDF
jgi:NAD(P)H-dependent FMN reductase